MIAYMKRSPATVAAVFNTSHDVVEMIRYTLQQAGIVVVSAFTHELRDGVVDIEKFIRQHDPRVIVYDIAPPYEPNWRLFEHFQTLPVMAGRQFVLTSPNASQVEKVAAKFKQPIYEIVGKPLDLTQLARAVKEASRARPTR
jgi:DNA-binding NtrC family response regulator